MRHTDTVHIHEAVIIMFFVYQLAGILLEMDSRDANPPCVAVDAEVAVRTERELVLRYLIRQRLTAPLSMPVESTIRAAGLHGSAASIAMMRQSAIPTPKRGRYSAEALAETLLAR